MGKTNAELTRQRLRGAWNAAILGCGFLLAMPSTAQAPTLAMLDRIEAGRWELRQHGRQAAAESLCIGNGRRLIQLRHPNVACESYVVEDSPNDVTVQYTCRGRGYGRTHIHRESGRLIQVESQGIAEGFPFEFAAEGRRIGDCTPAS